MTQEVEWALDTMVEKALAGTVDIPLEQIPPKMIKSKSVVKNTENDMVVMGQYNLVRLFVTQRLRYVHDEAGLREKGNE